MSGFLSNDEMRYMLEQQWENTRRHKLLLALGEQIPLPIDRFSEEITGSVYVFNKEQMQSFIRDIEDAVKESLST